MESLILNIIMVGISSSVVPFAIRKMTVRALRKSLVIFILVLNALAMICLWVMIRNLVLTGQLDSSPSGGTYITYGVGFATMAGWRLLLAPRPEDKSDFRRMNEECVEVLKDDIAQETESIVETKRKVSPARKRYWPLTIWITLAVVGIGVGIFVLINLAARRQLAPFVLATELKPHDPRAWLALASECHRLKRYSQAEGACKTALKLHPDDSMAFLFLGRIYRDQGRTSEAVYCYSQAKDGYAYSELGDLYTKTREFDMANTQYKMAISYWKHETESSNAFWLSWENLGDAYAKNGQRANARAAYETAARLAPDVTYLHEKLQKLNAAK